MILNKTSYSYFRFYNYPGSSGEVSEPVTLEAGKYYWVEVFAVNSSGTGYFTLSVETPAIGTTA